MEHSALSSIVSVKPIITHKHLLIQSRVKRVVVTSVTCIKNTLIRKSSSSYALCVKISLIHRCKVYFLDTQKTLFMTTGPIGAVFAN